MARAPARAAVLVDTFVEQLLERSRSSRIDNLLSQHGFCLRCDARPFLRANDVEVGGTRVHSGHGKVDPEAVTVNGAPLDFVGAPLHIALHKPAGYVCTSADDEGATIYDLLPSSFPLRKPGVAPVGRLDKGASGLLLLTQSGALNEHLTSPRRAVGKAYVVALDRAPGAGGWADLARAFASGTLMLVDGAPAAPAELTPHASHGNVARIVLREGRFHQLRRMFTAAGYACTGLHREGVGGLRLRVPPGPPCLDGRPVEGAAVGGEVALREGEWTLLGREQLGVLLGPSG
jgi:16S rRNA pseudouridine516 synthase